MAPFSPPVLARRRQPRQIKARLAAFSPGKEQQHQQQQPDSGT